MTSTSSDPSAIPGAARPFVPGLEALVAMEAVKGPDGVWVVLAPIDPAAGGIDREGAADWKPAKGWARYD